MNIDAVEKIANAVLYEGYLLYPYRASSIKNQLRFNFGVLYPRAYCEAEGGSSAWKMKTSCLATGDKASVEIKVRFLQLIEREGREEGVERSVSIPSFALSAIASGAFIQRFAFGDTICGELELSARMVPGASQAEACATVTLEIRNCSETGSLVSVHSIWKISGGEFISLLDPREEYKAAAALCENIGTYPVLAGDEGARDMILSSPIILYDYPQIAPESPGDLFDGTEIDEILALRILTLTDAEKMEVRNGDDRARRILERTESLPREHFQKLHGALRGLR